MKLHGSLSTKECSTRGTCRVYTEYSRIPTNKKHWRWSPVSQLLMPGNWKESLNITGYTVGAHDSIWLTTLPMWGQLEKTNICWKPLFKGNTFLRATCLWIVLRSDGCWERSNCLGHFLRKKAQIKALAGCFQNNQGSHLLKITGEEVQYSSCWCQDI